MSKHATDSPHFVWTKEGKIHRSSRCISSLGNANTNRNVENVAAIVKNVAAMTTAAARILAIVALTMATTSLSTSTPVSAEIMVHDHGSMYNAPITLALGVGAPSSSLVELVDSDAVVVRLDSGVTYRDLRDGTGNEVATEGTRVNIQWVLKRSNGYSIDASSNNDGVPFIFTVGGSKQQQRAIAGLDEGIRGMKIGGIRRIVLPPSLAYVEGLNDDGSSPGPVPVGFGPKQRIRRVMENRMDVPDESFLLDVKLTRIQ